MKRYLLLILFFFYGITVFAQADSVALKEAMAKLDKALVEKDYAILASILHPQLSFGHSNGWVQTKQDVLDDFKSGKLVYQKFENSNIRLVTVNKKWATVRTISHASGTVNGNGFDLNLHILQVWTKNKKAWQLTARQSAKLN